MVGDNWSPTASMRTLKYFLADATKHKARVHRLDLCLAASAKKYFNLLMEDVGDQVSPTISLFCRYPLTTILNFYLSRLPSDWIFAFYASIHGITGSPSFWSSIKKVWLLIRFFISFWFSFSQGFFMFSDNFGTSENFFVSEWSGTHLNQILPKVSIIEKSLLQQS